MDSLRTVAARQAITISATEVIETMADEVFGNTNRRSGWDFVAADGEEDDDGVAVYAPVSLAAHTLIALGWQASEMADWNEYDIDEIIAGGRFPDVHLFSEEALAVLETAQLFADANTWGQCLAKVRKNHELAQLGAK